MKKILRKVCCLLTGIPVLTTTLNAQAGFQAGVHATPQFSWLMNQDDSDNQDFKYVTTLTGAFGIILQYNFSQQHGIGLDGLYSYQGQRYKLSDLEYFKRVDYIKVPLMYVYTYNFTDKTAFIGKIGPEAGFLADAKLLDKDGNTIAGDQKKLYKAVTMGGVAEAGLGFKLADAWFLSLLLRYDYTVGGDEDNTYNAHINKPNTVLSSSTRAETHNVTAGLMVGITYLFSAGK